MLLATDALFVGFVKRTTKPERRWPRLSDLDSRSVQISSTFLDAATLKSPQMMSVSLCIVWTSSLWSNAATASVFLPTCAIAPTRRLGGRRTNAWAAKHGPHSEFGQCPSVFGRSVLLKFGGGGVQFERVFAA